MYARSKGCSKKTSLPPIPWIGKQRGSFLFKGYGADAFSFDNIG